MTWSTPVIDFIVRELTGQFAEATSERAMLDRVGKGEGMHLKSIVRFLYDEDNNSRMDIYQEK